MQIKKKAAAAVLAASLASGAGLAAIMATPMSAFAADTSTTVAAESTARSPGQWMTDSLKGLVDKGTITQEQSDAVVKALEDSRPQPPEGGFGRGGRGGIGASMTAVAKVLGISEADLRTAMQSKSLADVAKDKGVDVQKVIDALVAERNARIDQQVTDGRLTKAQADEHKAKVTERVTDMVNSVRPERRPGGLMKRQGSAGAFGRGEGRVSDSDSSGNSTTSTTSNATA